MATSLSSADTSPVDPLAGSSSPKAKVSHSLSCVSPKEANDLVSRSTVPASLSGGDDQGEEDILRGIGETATTVLKDMTSWVSGHFRGSIVPAVRSFSAVQQFDDFLFPPVDRGFGSTWAGSQHASNPFSRSPFARGSHSAAGERSASLGGSFLTPRQLGASGPCLTSYSSSALSNNPAARSLVAPVELADANSPQIRCHEESLSGVPRLGSASVKSSSLISGRYGKVPHDEPPRLDDADAGVGGEWSFKLDGLFSSFISFFDGEDGDVYPRAPRGFPGEPPSYGPFPPPHRPDSNAFSHAAGLEASSRRNQSFSSAPKGETAVRTGTSQRPYPSPSHAAFFPSAVSQQMGASEEIFGNGGFRMRGQASVLPSNHMSSKADRTSGNTPESPVISPRNLEEPADGTVKPQTWLECSAARTLSCVTRSHVELSLQILHNIGKVVCSTVISGQARLRCPGFNMLHLRIPLYDLHNQVISVAFSVRMSHSHVKVLQMLDRDQHSPTYLSSDVDAFAKKCDADSRRLRLLRQLDWHRRTDEDRKKDTCVLNFRVDIPISEVEGEGSPVWTCLTEDRPIPGLTTKDLFSRLRNNAETKVFQPRLQFSLRKVMTGIIPVPGEPHGIPEDHVYVGQFDDPIDIAVANALTGQSQLLARKKNITRLSQGKYDIDGYECTIFLQPSRLSGLPPDRTGLETTRDDDAEELNQASETKTPLVVEGGAQQPLLDYLRGSLDNVVWEEQNVISAIDMVEPQLLPSFQGTPIPWEAKVDRRVAMALACHRAAVREQVATELLQLQGKATPSLIYAKHAHPVSLRLGADTAPVRVTYTWGDEYSDIQLVVIEEGFVPPTKTGDSLSVTTTQEDVTSVN
ncbi:conserved hypothetical protein [Neospora caninum Liverpool]|uniref:Uncharacterized protein n=1 Tax=Neospora caninum (strain Liverpool) TaxID=572307 RepID=F0V911_NEOCL|nr:conserved hypothetical protein [Neospora caninum Liverpool]CBZ50202.1 conserved hypothetical protein [Neospora caninum Liverpool]CEL64803.1 TPA: hypothetical protein BN1204_006770 [Neospora caninum Liverpool]|eukprot:XP_003880237.1 conserved hypothetical protein [Neospora caninum Liverpool]